MPMAAHAIEMMVDTPAENASSVSEPIERLRPATAWPFGTDGAVPWAEGTGVAWASASAGGANRCGGEGDGAVLGRSRSGSGPAASGGRNPECDPASPSTSRTPYQS